VKRILPLAAFVIFALLCACTASSNPNGNQSSHPGTERQFASIPATGAQPSPPPQQSSPEQQRPLEAGDAAVISTRANLREKPKASSAVVVELAQDAQLKLLQQKPTGAWYSVQDIASGKSGWIHGNAIKLSVTAATNSAAPTQQKETRTGSSSSGTYTNVDGEQVERPRRSDSVPEGASARCGDGTYSFSRHRRGTCSHHGGVAQWL
jgi:uncharacterized protein YgiM (DUF1202 family)